jgi:hypothetical protein
MIEKTKKKPAISPRFFHVKLTFSQIFAKWDSQRPTGPPVHWNLLGTGGSCPGAILGET